MQPFTQDMLQLVECVLNPAAVPLIRILALVLHLLLPMKPDTSKNNDITALINAYVFISV